MSEHTTATAELPVTKPLAFDHDSTEVPAFLRKEAVAQTDESEWLPHRESDYAVIDEPVADPVDTLDDDEVVTEIAEPDQIDVAVETAGRGLDQMSVDELRHQEEEIQRKIQEKQLAEKKAVINQVVAVLRQFQISTEEIVEALGGLKIKRKGVKAKPKYRDPISGAQWSGRGKEPAWIKGKNRDNFII